MGALLFSTIPVIANSSYKTFQKNTIFKKMADFRAGLQNSQGILTIQDSAQIENDLTVKGEATIINNLTAEGETTLENLTVQGSTNLALTARDITIANDDNTLSATNLQNVLDYEIALNLNNFLPGTSWTVTNTTSDTTYQGYTARITFSATDKTLNIEEGRFGAAGLIHKDSTTGEYASNPITYQIIGDNLIYFTWTGKSGDSTRSRSTIATVASKKRNSLQLVGFGGVGELGTPRVSSLDILEE